MNKVVMEHPYTKETKLIDVGWNWQGLFVLLFSIPLLMRKLWLHAGAVIILMFMPVFFEALDGMGGDESFAFVGLVQIAISVYYSIKLNELTIKNYLKLGWVVKNANEPYVDMNLKKMGVILPETAAPASTATT